MCGITAFQGNNAAKIAMDMTLCQMSRGTDGAGVAFIGDLYQRLHVVKEPIHPMTFAIGFNYFIDVKTNSAICHNRMPSKGAVNWVNTHPFKDCKNRFALIHNGTICDTDKHKERLRATGHKILGDTDSETYTHMICEQLDNGKTIIEALREMITAREVATILILDNKGTIYGLKGYMPMEICELKRGNEQAVAIASEENSIKRAINGYNTFERTWHETEYGDIITVKQCKVEIEHHPHKFTYTGNTNWSQFHNRDNDVWMWNGEDYEPATPTGVGATNKLKKYIDGVVHGKHGRGQTTITTYKSPRQRRIDRINEFRRRRGLPELTEADKDTVVDNLCANEKEGCPINCTGDPEYACFKKKEPTKRETTTTERPKGCADYKGANTDCPTSQCPIDKLCFRPKGCDAWVSTCPAIGQCLDKVKCYVKIQTLGELLDGKRKEKMEVEKQDETQNMATGAGNNEPSSATDSSGNQSPM